MGRGFSASAIYTVTAQNLHRLAEMPEILAREGVERFFIQVIGLRGKAAGNELQVSWEDWNRVVPRVAEHAARLGMKATWPKVYLDADEPFECAGLVAENYFLFPNGRVYRCPLCEDYPLHSLEFVENRLAPRPGVHEAGLFTLDIPEGCVMNKLIQPENIPYDDQGQPLGRIACCMLKTEVSP